MTNRKNLQKLATYLYYGNGSQGVKFDMGQFTEPDSKFYPGVPGVGETHCSTAGCAVGFAPFAGIRKFKAESFYDYSLRTLTNDAEEWKWCFNQRWADIHGTRKGAAKRIQYFLDNGLPENFWIPFPEHKKLYSRTKVKQ